MTNSEDISDRVFDAYTKWKESESVTEELHKEFSRLAEEAYNSGTRSACGLTLNKVESNKSKLDVTMFRTLHEERYNQLVENGSVSIPMSAIKEFENEVSDCIDVKKSTYYTLTKPR